MPGYAFFPTAVPEWASRPTNVATPTVTESTTGWSTNQAPPSSYFNWLQGLTYQWIDYLRYEQVLNDDFVRARIAPNVFDQWTCPSGALLPFFSNGTNTYLTNHAALLQSTGSTSYIECPFPGTVNYNNVGTGAAFRMQMNVTTFRGTYSASGAVQGFGIKDKAEFMATGATGFWYFGWQPTSTFSMTSIALGATYFEKRIEWHWQQPTLTVTWFPIGFITPTRLSTPITFDDNADTITVRQWMPSGAVGSMSLDRISVAILRDLQGV